MASDVLQLKRVVDNAWDDADRAVDREIDIIVAEHSKAKAIRSGATIKRVVRAAEPLAKAAFETGRNAIGSGRSVILRVKLSEFQAARISAFIGAIETRLEALGLGDKAGKVLLAEALRRATRAEPSVPVKSRKSQIAAWGRKAGSYIGHNVVLVLALAVATAVILKAMNLD